MPIADSQHQTKNICPVCGYPDMSQPAYNEFKNGTHVICSSCNYQFGFDDDAQHITHEQWRQKWIQDDMPWRGAGKKKPKDWNPNQQLLNIGVKA